MKRKLFSSTHVLCNGYTNGFVLETVPLVLKDYSRKTLYFRLKTDLRKSIFEGGAGYYLKWPYALFCDIIIL